MAASKATGRRDAKAMEVLTSEIVPGDMLLLKTGDKVPADARLIDVSNMRINEAVLTGESMPVEKHTEAVSENTPIAERKNLVVAFTGYFVLNNLT